MLNSLRFWSDRGSTLSNLLKHHGTLHVQITSRSKVASGKLAGYDQIPPFAGGLECVVVIDEHYARYRRPSI
jgi:hypothetical protein